MNKSNTQKDLWDGKRYKVNSTPQEESASQIINSVTFNGNEYVLDIGCGDGKITKKLSLLIPNGKIIGIDPSANMIAEAREHAKNNVHFFKQSAEHFSLTEKFDYVFSFFALHWIVDKLPVFKNIYNHLNAGGEFIFITGGSRKNPIIVNIITSPKWLKLMPQKNVHFYPINEGEAKNLLHNAGFSTVEAKAEFWPQFYSNKEELVKWMMGWVPVATGLDTEKATALSVEVAEALEKESIANGLTGKIEYKTEMLTAKALK